MDQKIENNFAKVDGHFKQVDLNFSEVEKSFKQVDQNFSEVDNSLISLDSRVTALESGARCDQATVENVEVGIVNSTDATEPTHQHEFDVRVDNLEKRVDAVEVQIEAFTESANELMAGQQQLLETQKETGHAVEQLVDIQSSTLVAQPYPVITVQRPVIVQQPCPKCGRYH